MRDCRTSLSNRYDLTRLLTVWSPSFEANARDFCPTSKNGYSGVWFCVTTIAPVVYGIASDISGAIERLASRDLTNVI